MGGYEPHFDAPGSIDSPTTEADLDINYNRAILVFFGLINVTNLGPDLSDVNSAITDLNSADDIQSLLTTCSKHTLTCETIPSAADIYDASWRFGIIGNVFFENIKKIWGVDDDMAIAMLGNDFDPELGFTFDEFIGYFEGAIAIAGLALLAYATGGGSLTVSGLAIGSIIDGLGVIGLGALAADITDDLNNHRISIEDAIVQGLIAITLQGIGGPIASKIGTINSELTAVQKEMLANWVMEGFDTAAGAPTSYSGDLEDIIALISSETGRTPDQVGADLETARAAMQEHNRVTDDLTYEPTADLIHSIPVRTDYPGTMGNRVDPVTGDTVMDNMTPSEQAWWEHKKLDYIARFGDRVSGDGDFYQWLLAQDIPRPPKFTDEWIRQQGHIAMTTGPCTPSGL